MCKHLPVFIIFIFAVLGCASTQTIESTQVLPSDIYQGYNISAKKNSTSVTATFRVASAGGTTIDLDAPCKIELNGQPMRESAPFFLKGTTYEFSTNEFLSKVQFQYTDAEAKVYTNESSINALEIVQNPGELSINQSNVIQFSRPVAKNEEVWISVNSSETPPEVQSNATNNQKSDSTNYSIDEQIDVEEGKSALVIDPAKLKDFKLGKATVKITVKKREIIKQTTNKGGEISFSYESTPINVNIVN